MFSKLKDKLKSWTKKVSEEKKEEIVEEPIEEVKKTKKKQEKPKEKKPKKASSSKKDDSLTLVDTVTSHKEPKIVEENVQKDEETPKKKSFISKITSKTTKISEEDFEKYKDDLEYALLENNVAFEAVDKIINKLKNKLTSNEISKKDIENEIKKYLEETIKEILIEPFDLVNEIKKSEKPYVILLCGINGSGKTTTTAKLANKLQKEKLKCVFAAADTFRSAAIEQIKQHGEKLGVKVISHEYNSDPASVGFDAIKYAKKNNIDVVLIDTAGRIHTDKNLMSQIEKITRVCKPNKKIFIGESITGNDSVEQVKAFDEAVSIDGIILTKADVDEKGGTALSVGYVTGKPILYLGVGQEYDKLEKFNKDDFIEKLGL